ncbi:MAG: hypothetical protein H0T47_02275 [Planctomycetaceae bacterium]|nr:hypothetical protein [Planctomycetaceae bacterium]
MIEFVDDASASRPGEMESSPETLSATAILGSSSPPKAFANFEQQVRAAQNGIKAGQSPSQVKAALLAGGSDPLTAETAYRTARRRLFESNRRLGARLAAYAIAALCGGTLLFVPLGWTIPLVVVLLAGLLLMGVATLVWLTGLGADEP